AGVTAASLVSTKAGSTNAVELATADTANRLAGIVSNKPLIELSDGTNGVQVVTSGLTLTLVSDVNGAISTGDKITASPIEGVGMKTTTDSVVVGTAQKNLKDVDLDSRTITAKDGTKQTVHIGLVPVQVSVAFYSQNVSKDSSFVPAFLQSMANGIAGHSVSETRVLIAGLILLLVFVAVAALLYASVRSSIISIGRNPLSAHAVRKSLIEVALGVLAVLLFATIIVYVVLTA
ncbi:MAG TPA: hypothetical protein VH144_01550, partial [Candidatus Saccharimonadales bacterium]|nr:hypothetical protein [Candidatus Saccharimonadales bacterium]